MGSYGDGWVGCCCKVKGGLVWGIVEGGGVEYEGGLWKVVKG